MKTCYIKYPCGKKFEIRVPITILDINGKSITILPGDAQYFHHAKNKFQINNLKVVEEDCVSVILDNANFVSLNRKKRSID